MKAYIKKINLPGYKLKKPIPLRVKKINDEFLADNEDLAISGWGDTEIDAIEDAEEDLITWLECFEKLTPNSLSQSAASILHRLTEYIEKIENE